jgi:hypothetical protein
LPEENEFQHNEAESLILYLSGGKCDKWLKAGARDDSPSTEEEDVTVGRAASNGIGGRVVGIAESMVSQLLPSPSPPPKKR